MQTPPKPNYQRELEQTLSTIPAGTKTTLVPARLLCTVQQLCTGISEPLFYDYHLFL